ncbi:zgc:103586 isoform X1 [Puntigrus tetrazona]|uniref:zgc:103586 isoform X1 n=1 Tax=Puntigrus tetrazona TaxID=1606681 RepID=UPI001C89B1AB|nr:zgc:103586 isoform X1 [Puntigrus tetrazona]
MEATETAARKSFIVVINMIVWMILITAIGLGAIHFYECPVQPNLPTYVTVIGAAGLLSLLIMYLRNTLDDCLLVGFCGAFSCTLYLFIVCWFIAGTYWIYSIYPPNYVPTGDHCHKTLYLFAFWINNLGFLCVFILSLFALYTTLTRKGLLFTDRTLYVKI